MSDASVVKDPDYDSHSHCHDLSFQYTDLMKLVAMDPL